jgi:hypothetical protein
MTDDPPDFSEADDRARRRLARRMREAGFVRDRRGFWTMPSYGEVVPEQMQEDGGE